MLYWFFLGKLEWCVALAAINTIICVLVLTFGAYCCHLGPFHMDKRRISIYKRRCQSLLYASSNGVMNMPMAYAVKSPLDCKECATQIPSSEEISASKR